MRQTALIVIDVQEGLFKRENKVYNEEMLLQNINYLIDTSRQRNIPILFIRHANSFLLEGTDEWNIHSALCVSSDDLVFNKSHSSIFEEKRIVKELEDRKIKNLIIAGLVTHGCVKAACIDAKNFGYEVTLVEDAHSNFNANPEVLIEEWNQKLMHLGINVIPTKNVHNN